MTDKVYSEDKKEDKKFTYEKTMDAGGVRKSLKVEELDKGYLVTITKEYEDDEKGWQYDCKKYAFMENPLEKIKEPKEDELLDSMGSLFDSMNYNM